MSANPAQSLSAASLPALDAAAEQSGEKHSPLCFVIATDASIRHFLSLILHGVGIDTEEFADDSGLKAALPRRKPVLVCLELPLESADAIACVAALGTGGYCGQGQLMSSRGSAVLAHVKGIGEQ